MSRDPIIGHYMGIKDPTKPMRKRVREERREREKKGEREEEAEGGWS